LLVESAMNVSFICILMLFGMGFGFRRDEVFRNVLRGARREIHPGLEIPKPAKHPSYSEKAEKDRHVLESQASRLDLRHTGGLTRPQSNVTEGATNTSLAELRDSVTYIHTQSTVAKNVQNTSGFSTFRNVLRGALKELRAGEEIPRPVEHPSDSEKTKKDRHGSELQAPSVELRPPRASTGPQTNLMKSATDTSLADFPDSVSHIHPHATAAKNDKNMSIAPSATGSVPVSSSSSTTKAGNWQGTRHTESEDVAHMSTALSATGSSIDMPSIEAKGQRQLRSVVRGARHDTTNLSFLLLFGRARKEPWEFLTKGEMFQCELLVLRVTLYLVVLTLMLGMLTFSHFRRQKRALAPPHCF